MKNNAILISTGIIGSAAIALIYYFNTTKNSSNDNRRMSVDSNENIGDLPRSREPSLDNGSRESSIDSAGTYDYFFNGGTKRKIKSINKTKRNKNIKNKTKRIKNKK